MLRVSPKLVLNGALGFACPAVIRVARNREVIVTCGRRPTEFLARCHSKCPSFAGMIDRFLEAMCLQRNFCQKRVEPSNSHGFNESRHKALDEHKAFARGKLKAAMDELPNCRVVQPLVERTLPCIDAWLSVVCHELPEAVRIQHHRCPPLRIWARPFHLPS